VTGTGRSALPGVRLRGFPRPRPDSVESFRDFGVQLHRQRAEAPLQLLDRRRSDDCGGDDKVPQQLGQRHLRRIRAKLPAQPFIGFELVAVRLDALLRPLVGDSSRPCRQPPSRTVPGVSGLQEPRSHHTAAARYGHYRPTRDCHDRYRRSCRASAPGNDHGSCREQRRGRCRRPLPCSRTRGETGHRRSVDPRERHRHYSKSTQRGRRVKPRSISTSQLTCLEQWVSNNVRGHHYSVAGGRCAAALDRLPR
jgi:hypothetical protein